MTKKVLSPESEILRRLPAVDALLRSAAENLIKQYGAKRITAAARAVCDELRQEVRQMTLGANGTNGEISREHLLEKAEKQLVKFFEREQNFRTQRVINATGVIIHTNLGRAPLSEAAIKAISAEAARYCNLEYNLETGKRGRRAARVEHLLAALTGAENALVVNNCAAAAFLVLTVLARGGEAIVSRGELVEIGGDFRVPDVMEQSGAILREVGATNRTKLADYERAINENTRVLMKVHPSNYRIIGFTESPPLKDLADLAHRSGVLLYEDAGSGALFDMSEYGLTDEPIIAESIAAGADIVTFSGDKLLGGVQSGLIVGRREIIEKIRKHPLYRALRVDKLAYAALEATLAAFERETAWQEIPVLQMISQTPEEIAQRTEKFAKKLSESATENSALKYESIAGKSVIGGGSAPDVQPETTLLAVKHNKMSADKLEETLRRSRPPVIARILEDQVVIDLRTVAESEEAELLEVFVKL